MAKVEPATQEMIPEITRLLLEFDNPLITGQDWERMLQACCAHDDDAEHFSYVLVDEKKDKQIVGFIGRIFSSRFINGKDRKLCNMTSWIVKKKYRLEALKLLNACLRLKDHTLSNLSPTEDVHKLFLRMGFKELENSYVLLSPATHPGATLSFPWFWTTGDPERIKERLSGIDAQIFTDHLNSPCAKHLLLYNNNAYCYVVSSIKIIKKIPCSWIQYISDSELFFTHLAKVKWGLFKTNRTLFTMLDSRFVQNRSFPLAVKRDLDVPRLYRPAEDDFAPEMLDGVYTEYMWVTPP